MGTFVYSPDAWASRPTKLTDTQLIAWAICQLTDALHMHTYNMGTRDAATPMGAAEIVGVAITDAGKIIADSIEARLEGS